MRSSHMSIRVRISFKHSRPNSTRLLELMNDLGLFPHPNSRGARALKPQKPKDHWELRVHSSESAPVAALTSV